MELGGILLSGDSVEIHLRIDKEGFQCRGILLSTGLINIMKVL